MGSTSLYLLSSCLEDGTKLHLEVIVDYKTLFSAAMVGKLLQHIHIFRTLFSFMYVNYVHYTMVSFYKMATYLGTQPCEAAHTGLILFAPLSHCIQCTAVSLYIDSARMLLIRENFHGMFTMMCRPRSSGAGS